MVIGSLMLLMLVLLQVGSRLRSPRNRGWIVVVAVAFLQAALAVGYLLTMQQPTLD